MPGEENTADPTVVGGQGADEEPEGTGGFIEQL